MRRTVIPLICLIGLILAVAAPAVVPAGAAVGLADHPLGQFEDDTEGWDINLGAEFPGAQGTFTRVDSAPHSGGYSGRLHGDFTAGGNYVEAFRTIERLDLQKLSFWARTAEADTIGLRLTDSTGQVHQHQLQLAGGGAWQQVERTQFASSSHWGGANDGVWHGPATRIGFLLDKGFLADGVKSGDIFLDDVVASAPQPDLVIGQTRLGNVFFRGEPIELSAVTAGTTVSWVARDFWGTEVTRGSVAAPEGTASIRPQITNNGYYTLDITAKGADGSVLATAKAPLALLSPFDVKDVAQSPFGIGTHFAGYNPDMIPLLARAGIKNVRNDLTWGAIERVKGQYTFESYDHTMAELESAGIEVLPIVDYTNQFYDNNATPYTDAGREGFGNYSAATLDHYNDQLESVEVYNEFNIPGFGDRGDGPADAKAEYYYPLLKTTYEKLKAVDPNVDVIGPASAGVPLGWLETLFQLGGLRYMDKVSIHPYQYPTPPESVVGNLDAVADLIKEYNGGKSKPLWITEQGWPTHTGASGVSEQTQAAYLVRAYTVALSRGTEKFFWYDFMNDGLDPAYNENNFGIIRNTDDPMGRWTPKPAYVAYAVMARQLTGATFQVAENLGAFTYSMRFTKAGKALRVLWSTQPATVSLQTEDPINVTDLTGVSRTYNPGPGGVVSLSLSGDPIYVSSATAAKVNAGSKFRLHNPGNAFVGDDLALTLSVDNTSAPVSKIDGTFQISGKPVAVKAEPGQKIDIPVVLPAENAVGLHKYSGDLVLKGKPVARLATQVDVRFPFKSGSKHIASDGKEVLRMSVENVSTRELTIDGLEWKVGDRSGTALAGTVVGPNSTRSADVPLSDLPAGTYPLRTNLEVADYPPSADEGKVVVVSSDSTTPLASKRIAVDGTLDDLTGAPGVDLAADGKVIMRDYGGANDLSGDVWFTWDSQALYVSAQIQDNAFSQAESGRSIFEGDSIQFAVTPGTPGESSYGYEYGMALSPTGPEVYAWSTIEGSPGQVTDADVAVRRDEAAKRTIYELALPWDRLAPSVSDDGLLSLSMLVNDNDGSGRKGYIEWGSGIGSTKDASLFKAVVLRP